jgi:hypothetical protein
MYNDILKIQKQISELILRIPTGGERNLLTDLNIQLLSILDKRPKPLEFRGFQYAKDACIFADKNEVEVVSITASRHAGDDNIILFYRSKK